MVRAQRLRLRKGHQEADGVVGATETKGDGRTDRRNGDERMSSGSRLFIPFPSVRLSVAVVLLAACATLRNLAFTDADLELREIDVTGIGFTGGTFDLVFDVYNPNDYRIRSTRLEVGIDLEGTHFGDGLVERPLDLSPSNHSRVIVPVRFEWAGLGAGARALLARQALGYGVAGRVVLDTPVGDRTVTLEGKGNVPLKKLVK